MELNISTFDGRSVPPFVYVTKAEPSNIKSCTPKLNRRRDSTIHESSSDKKFSSHDPQTTDSFDGFDAVSNAPGSSSSVQKSLLDKASSAVIGAHGNAFNNAFEVSYQQDGEDDKYEQKVLTRPNPRVLKHPVNYWQGQMQKGTPFGAKTDDGTFQTLQGYDNLQLDTAIQTGSQYSADSKTLDEHSIDSSQSSGKHATSGARHHVFHGVNQSAVIAGQVNGVVNRSSSNNRGGKMYGSNPVGDRAHSSRDRGERQPGAVSGANPNANPNSRANSSNSQVHYKNNNVWMDRRAASDSLSHSRWIHSVTPPIAVVHNHPINTSLSTNSLATFPHGTNTSSTEGNQHASLPLSSTDSNKPTFQPLSETIDAPVNASSKIEVTNTSKNSTKISRVSSGEANGIQQQTGGLIMPAPLRDAATGFMLAELPPLQFGSLSPISMTDDSNTKS